MHDLGRIQHLLVTRPLNHELFERCAQDLLSENYPGLTPIPGGTDWGRDADVAAPDGTTPQRVLATTSRTLEGVRGNMLRGLNRMQEKNEPVDRIILANLASLNRTDRDKLSRSANRHGARLDASDIFDRGYFASALRRDGYWRQALLGLSSEPITLSRIPPELAESPWAHLPLIGRERELAELQRISTDVIVSGPPGVGKSRVVQELEDVVFIDHNATFNQISDDLRWACPSIVVVDDAGQAGDLVERLLWLRNAEQDMLSFRVIVICWPDETDAVADTLRRADTIGVELMEPRDIDSLIVSMGITGQLARTEIIDQAEGRPGWAVALGDILLRGDGSSSLLQGKALYGEVSRFLRRAGMGTKALDVLAAVSALGGVYEGDLPDIATELGIERNNLARLITAAAHSGLVDVESVYSGDHERNVRHYEVRPPMLADVLVAERVFAAAVPAVDLDRVMDRWPERLAVLAEACIDAAHVGAVNTREVTTRFFKRAMEDDDVETHTKIRIAQKHAALDRAAGQETLGLLEQELATALQSTPTPWSLEPISRLARFVAGRYLLPNAVTLLLEIALFDDRPPHSNLGSALRQLSDLVHTFHPELEIPRAQRDLVAEVIDDWIATAPSDRHWAVYGHQVENILSLHLTSVNPTPGDRRVLQIAETVVDAGEIERIYEQLWPKINRRLLSTPAYVLKSAVTAAEDWLRIGGGFDQPFGRNHPQSAVEAARRFGERLLRDLVGHASRSVGITTYVLDVSDNYGVAVDLEMPADVAAFFADIDRQRDWESAIAALGASIRQVVEPWSEESPPEVLTRLHEIREQLALSQINWPDRVRIACSIIAARVQPRDWIDAAIASNLLSEVVEFVSRACELGQELGSDRLSKLLGDSVARWGTIQAVLTSGSNSDINTVVLSLGAHDYGILETLFIRRQVSDDVAHALLTAPDPAVRGAAAAAMFSEAHGADEWEPRFLDDWCAAIGELDMTIWGEVRGYEASRLAEFLARSFPDTLVSLIEAGVSKARRNREYTKILPHDAWNSVHHLPWQAKDRLWQFGRRDLSWLLAPHLVGTDAEWLGHAIDEHIMTVDEALSSYIGLEPHPSIEELAEVFVPRGVDPAHIAGLARWGSHVGEESDHYAELLERFRVYEASNNEYLSAVGSVGVSMYEAARAEALEKERKRRIQGNL